jgi:hypothetical protein
MKMFRAANGLKVATADSALLVGPVLLSKAGGFLAHRGNWAFYVGRLEAKILYARDGLVDCLHRTAPDRAKLFAGLLDDVDFGRYSASEWKAALAKPVRRRAVENFIAARRLFHAGLGPEPYALCHVPRFRLFGRPEPTETAGIVIQNINSLGPRPPATREQMIACGVMPDRIESSLRQQIRGYVSDLNSVCGVMPIDAEREIDAMVQDFERAIFDGSD